MNELERYKSKILTESIPIASLMNGWEEGFDDAIALDLPVKFHNWFTGWKSMALAEFDQKYSGKRPEFIPLKERVKITHRDPEEAYKYWIDNIYKIE
jgi:hypothetical protein